MSGLELFLAQLVDGVTRGGIYALIALGYTMVYGIIELINFAHGDVFMMGAFFAVAIMGAIGMTTVLTGPALVAGLLALMLITGILTGLLGVVVERVAYRPLRKAPKLAPLIAAIGVSFILQDIVFVRVGPDNVRFPDIMPNPALTFGTVSITAKEVLIVVSSLVLMIVLRLFVQKTRLGKAMRATAQDQEAAALMGISVNLTIALTFFIGSLLAGTAGIIYGLYYHSIRFNIGFDAGLKAFTAAVLGGIGDLTGAMTGGFLIGIISAMATQYLPGGDAWSDAVVFALLIAMLVFRPQGLFGQPLPERA